MNAGLLFEGIGGLGLGFERAGIAGDWSCEIDKDARQVLSDQWPFTPCFNDVKEIDGSAPRVDVLCGGFPCQDLSVAGNRAGLAGERSGLFHEFIRIAGALAPRWVVIENVPGLLSSEDGRDMGTVLGTLADLGYGWAYRVLDAQFFGVAQRRRRVFIVGCLGDSASAAQVLFEPESCDGDLAPSREAGTRVAALTANGVGTCGADDNQGQAGHLIAAHETGQGWWKEDDKAGTLRAEGENRPSRPSHLIADTLRSHPRPGSNSNGALVATETGHGWWTESKIAGTMQARDAKDARTVVAFHQTQDPISEDEMSPCLGAKSIGMGVAFSENQRGELIESDYSHQLTTGGGKPGQGYPAVREGMSVRRLTPMECERLQGFPDGWTKSLSDSARYRTLGNAVAVPVAEWIGRRLMAAM